MNKINKIKNIYYGTGLVQGILFGILLYMILLDNTFKDYNIFSYTFIILLHTLIINLLLIHREDK